MTATLEPPRSNILGFEGRLVPFIVVDVGTKERERQVVDDLLNPVLAIGEFPVSGHGIGFQARS
jgi:hypothetical protein